MVFDAHIHNINKESGGFIIGLEGQPHFENTLGNEEVMALHDPMKNYFAFYYMTKEECQDKVIKHPYLKYHPRREKYNVSMVIQSIARNQPKAVIIDTLNEPFWKPYDYWNIARCFPDIKFIFAHSGGYLINDFIKICHFQSNVWIDFALTHTVLGHYGDKIFGLHYVNEAIQYSLKSIFCNRILLSSDYPFFSQEDVFYFYRNHIRLLNSNYLKLVEGLKCQ